MNNQFLSGSKGTHILKTILLLLSALALIGIALLAGVGDNFPMTALLFVGVITFFFALLRHWQKASYYAIMTGAFTVILILVWVLKESLGEDIAMISGLISVSAIIAGVVGMYSFSGKFEDDNHPL